jgi:predicted metal-binding membrane protein
MRGMDMGPGTDPGPFAWFAGVWLTMTVAMMLPSAAPAAARFAGLRSAVDGWALVLGYVLAWLAAARP